VNIARGEVLFDKRGYVSPSIEKKLTAKGKRWLDAKNRKQKTGGYILGSKYAASFRI